MMPAIDGILNVCASDALNEMQSLMRALNPHTDLTTAEVIAIVAILRAVHARGHRPPPKSPKPQPRPRRLQAV